MPTTATSRLSGFFTGAGSSPVVNLYASACAVIAGETGVRDGSVKTRGWSIRADQIVVGSTDNGRPVYGYPAPGTPAWVTFGPGSGALLVAGVDFDTSDDYVWFHKDPILSAPVKYLVWVDGSPVTAADAWWGDHLFAQVSVEPLEGTVAAMSQAVSSACDSPCTANPYETVSAVWLGPDSVYRVATDIAGYVLPEGDTPSVSVGDVLPLGSPLGTAWELARLGPDASGLDWFTTPASFHLGVTTGGITWFNENTPLIVDVVDDRTRVRWSLGGTQQDVDDFWDASHAYGTEPGARSLAQAMDTRQFPSGDPGPESLPTNVNPLQFICRELFAGTAYCLLVRPGKFGPDGVADAAERATRIRAAVGPNIAIFEYEDSIPQTPPVDPS